MLFFYHPTDDSQVSTRTYEGHVTATDDDGDDAIDVQVGGEWLHLRPHPIWEGWTHQGPLVRVDVALVCPD